MTRDGFEFVGISNNGGHDSERQLFGLEVTARMQFVSMHPSIGYTHGGTEVTITLGNLKHISNLRCLFETASLPASLISVNTVVCISPPYPVGEATVKLMSSEMLLATSTFEYIYPPTVDSLRPAFGDMAGGTILWLYGDGFIGVTHCRFLFYDNAIMVPAKVESDLRLSCGAPASENYTNASVGVTHNGQDFPGTGLFVQVSSTTSLVFNLAVIWIRYRGKSCTCVG